MKLTDILLLPEKLYRNLTAKRFSLYLGVLFIGLADLALPNLRTSFDRLFSGKSPDIAAINALLTVILVIFLGAVDAAFFSIPLFDLFKVFKKDREIKDSGELRIKLVKIYVMAHIIIIPVGIIYYLAFKDLNDSSSYAVIQIAAILSLVIEIWFSAIISHGVNTVYTFNQLFRRLVFPVVFLWNSVFGYVLGFAISNWIMRLYR